MKNSVHPILYLNSYWRHFPEKFISGTPHMCAKHCNGCEWSIIEGILHEEMYVFACISAPIGAIYKGAGIVKWRQLAHGWQRATREAAFLCRVEPQNKKFGGIFKTLHAFTTNTVILTDNNLLCISNSIY